MAEYSFLIGIAIALLLGVMSPGPSFLVVSKVAVDSSRTHGLMVVLGLGLGAAIITLLAVLGLYAVLQAVPWLYLVLKLVGAVYLCYLAFKIWRSADDSIAADSQAQANNSLWRSFLMGLLTQLSNPKTAIIIGGIIVAFLPPNPPAHSYTIIPVMAFLIDASWYALVALALSTQRAQAVYLRFKGRINKAASGFMVFMGLKIALDS